MNSGGNIPRSGLSPVSVAGSDWSGISGYQNRGSDQLYGGPPPRSASLANGDGMGPPGQRQNSSPPSSVARSSDGTGLYAQSDTSSLRDIIQEEEVSTHHSALRRLLQPYLSQQGGSRPNKARDKLLRLSVIQFQELSTDVYDELQRREGVAASAGADKSPPYLLAKERFHPKRNQARRKLSSLPAMRFRDLATDVFYELERRYPKFATELTRDRSPTNSIDGRGVGPPARLGSPGPGRVGSPSPGGMGPGRMSSPGPGQMRGGGSTGPYGPGPGGPNGMSRVGPPGSLRGPPGVDGGGGSPNRPDHTNSFGRSLPKTSQSGTVVPNKSIMVEEDGDDDNEDDDDDGSAFGLEDANRRPNGNRSGPPGTSTRRSSGRSLSSVANGGSSEVDKRLIAEYQSKVEILQDKIVGLEASLDDKDQEIARRKEDETRRENNLGLERQEWDTLKHDLEEKLAHAQNLNQNLQSEIAKVKLEKSEKSEKSASERNSTNQLRDSQQSIGGSGDQKYNELLRQHEELKADLREQEEVTEEVRREAMEFLNQMKSISERADHSFEQEERLGAEITKLQEEIKEWKARYARSKATLRSLRTSSMGLALQSPSTSIAKEGGLSDPNGLVRDVHVTKFQISIDELLRVARGVNYAQTLEYVKAVVIATRSITKGIDESGAHTDDRGKLISRVSATANNLTTAAKNHATGGGLSPVSLVDAAASHLTASIVELIKIVKIRPTPREEFEDDGEDIIVSPESAVMGDGEVGGMLSQRVNGAWKGSGESRGSADSVYSPVHSPRHSRNRSRNESVGGKDQWPGGPQPGSARVPSFGVRTSESNVEELRIFLETQTEGIVESIQSLLTSIRSDCDMHMLRKHVEDITVVVGKVVQSTEISMQQPGNMELRERGGWIAANLTRCVDSMGAVANEGEPIDGPADKEFKGRLAALAFDLARETKELVRTVEDIDSGASRGLIQGDDSLHLHA